MTPTGLQRAVVTAWCGYCGAEIGVRSVTCVQHAQVRILDERVPAESWPRAEWAWEDEDFVPTPALTAALLELVA